MKKTHRATVLKSEIECEPDNSLCLGSRGDLQALHDTREALMFQTRIFTLRVLADDSKVDVLVPGGNTWKGFAEDDRGIDIKLLTHGDVPGEMSFDGSEQNALKRSPSDSDCIE
jgi:hypothetical protein